MVCTTLVAFLASCMCVCVSQAFCLCMVCRLLVHLCACYAPYDDCACACVCMVCVCVAQEPMSQEMKVSVYDKDMFNAKELVTLNLGNAVGSKELLGRTLVKLAPISAQVRENGHAHTHTHTQICTQTSAPHPCPLPLQFLPPFYTHTHTHTHTHKVRGHQDTKSHQDPHSRPLSTSM